MNAPLIKR